MNVENILAVADAIEKRTISRLGFNMVAVIERTTDAQAVRTLRRLAATGEVNWHA